jgi:thioredoxin 1
VGLLFHHKAVEAHPGHVAEILDRYNDQYKLPVLVEFAEKDAPACRMEEPVLNQVLRRFADRLAVVQADTASSPEDAERYGVAAVPTFILFEGGKEVWRLVGYQTADTLIKKLEETLGELGAGGAEG